MKIIGTPGSTLDDFRASDALLAGDDIYYHPKSFGYWNKTKIKRYKQNRKYFGNWVNFIRSYGSKLRMTDLIKWKEEILKDFHLEFKNLEKIEENFRRGFWEIEKEEILLKVCE